MSNTTSTRQKKPFVVELSPLAQAFLTWARALEIEDNRRGRGTVFTTAEALRWVMDLGTWNPETWGLITDELGFGPQGKRLIHEHRTGQWRLTALGSFRFLKPY